MDFEIKWFRLYRAFTAYKSHPIPVEVISRAIVEYAPHTEIAADSTLTRPSQQTPSLLRIKECKIIISVAHCLCPKAGKACQ